ncbi:BREX-1 system adenine-specific DNA-methyltransferase PglX [Metabacillus schmidteae]|uniref:BREX-1 system adenine-specific DNA-methyltransferase PglX n=1 Tax=Metabacillus schmidteae TaxID=2730405 RepID=UPI00158E4489|nr:BREX-1 system adenine-specific DNA-methyltransferase PglX [Metabacillus schmidteae]
MNKSALKTFATSARKELLKKVEAKAMKIGITEETIKKADVESSDAIFIDGSRLSKEEKIQRDKLIARINQMGFKQVMEEVAYTWFNRFTALRFMEVNDYLSTGVRVLSSSNPNSADPDMLNEALELDLEVELDKERIYNLKLNNETEELFKYLIIKHCNDLNRFLPFMFEMIDDYTEILFPEGLLAKDSFVRLMTDIDFIPEDNWQKVEVIGWLYQYYIAEEKDRVIQAKKKYKTEEIPFATQLFTPDWIVRYMVQNSLGRYWMESHPEHRELIDDWEFYLENRNREPDFEEKLAPYINKELKVEDIKCFDPAMGSGHILVYLFDVLYEIYSKCGYMEREIPRLIIENNLYGLDIDDRAYQLASFSVVMKALKYNSRFFRSIERDGLKLNLASLQETNSLNDEDITYIVGENNGDNFESVKFFIKTFFNAKTFGSLIKIKEYDGDLLYSIYNRIQDNPATNLFEEESRKKALRLLPQLIKQSEIMLKQYDIVITNPPYMGAKYMTKELGEYLQNEYPNSKSDLFSAFMEYITITCSKKGQIGLVTPFVWMFIKTYENLRTSLINNNSISSLVQLEYNSFETAAIPVCTFTLRNYYVDIPGEFVRLSDFVGVELQPQKLLEAVQNKEAKYRYTTENKSYKDIPSNPIAYWISDNIRETFRNSTLLSEIATPRQGIATADNGRFLRLWYEIDWDNFGRGYQNKSQAKESGKRWFPYNKGGEFRKWFGNNEWTVNWFNDGQEIKDFSRAVVRNPDYFFKEGITWSFISSTRFGVRYSTPGFIFDVGGSSLFVDEENLNYLMGFLCSKLTFELMKVQNPTMNFQVGNIANLPVIFPNSTEVKERINDLVSENINISKSDWDSKETSWDFKENPLVRYSKNNSLINDAWKEWYIETKQKFDTMKKNEEELNGYIIEIYKLRSEFTPHVEDRDVSVYVAELQYDIKLFMSYAVGCMFGRYSLDKQGIVCAGKEFNPLFYETFPVETDNILPILPGTYIDDDIVTRFIEFVKVTFGEDSLIKNLDFIADTIGRKKGEIAKETIGRYFLNDFFSDHTNLYSTRGRKAPIYWLFTSGKQKAFNCLVYIHRYDKTTLSRIRTDYLHEFQVRLDVERKNLLNVIEGDSTTKEISNAKKELKVLDKKIEEIKEYDELLHHMADMQIEINLDDGVLENHEKFKGLVAKI